MGNRLCDANDFTRTKLPNNETGLTRGVPFYFTAFSGTKGQ